MLLTRTSFNAQTRSNYARKRDDNEQVATQRQIQMRYDRYGQIGSPFFFKSMYEVQTNESGEWLGFNQIGSGLSVICDSNESRRSVQSGSTQNKPIHSPYTLSSVTTDRSDVKLVIFPLLAVERSFRLQLRVSFIFGDDLEGSFAVVLVYNPKTAHGWAYGPYWGRHLDKSFVLPN